MTSMIEYADGWLSRNPATLTDIPRSRPLACPMERLIYDMLAQGLGNAFLKLVPGAEKWASEMNPIALAFAFVLWLAKKGLTDKMAKTIPLEPTWGPMEPMGVHDILSYLDVVAWRRGEAPMRKECRFLARQLVETFMGKSDFGPDLIREFLEEKDGDNLTCGAILCAIGGEAHVAWRYRRRGARRLVIFAVLRGRSEIEAAALRGSSRFPNHPGTQSLLEERRAEFQCCRAVRAFSRAKASRPGTGWLAFARARQDACRS